jgi:hypothetical protein
MSALAVAPIRIDHLDGRPTLDDLIVSAWEGLAVSKAVACPVCDGELRPELRHPRAVEPGGTAPIIGRCHDCGSVLA